MLRWLWLTLVLNIAACWHCCQLLAADPQPEAPDPQAVKFFETKIRPILAARCFECHGPDSKPEGNLRLDSLAAMLRGGEIGPAIKPGDPKGSLLVDAVNHGDVVQMPPKTKLPAAEIADLTAWVAAGAPWPNAPKITQPATVSGSPQSLSAEDRSFWAFQAPTEPTVPAVNDTSWPTNTLDHFVLASLEARELRPAVPAERRTLLRRATFDLHGLPPTPAELHNFLADSSPDAFVKVVDRLLASPRYGERWGRRWLDLARYADSNGMDENMAMAHAWRYRDYVIGAFNKDKPYDQFIHEQLAGDLIPAADPATTFERLTATGFLVLGPKMLAEDDPLKMEMDIIDEQVDTIGRAFLGLTLGCARCHNHKFDPLPTTDYYSLAGIFKSTKTMENYRVVAMWSERPLATSEELAMLKTHEDQIAVTTRDIKTLQDAANGTLLDISRAKVAEYLLAAHKREQADRDLSPAFLESWVQYLARTKDDANSILRMWHVWCDAIEKETSPPADQTTPNEAALLQAPRPTSLDELAKHYAQLFHKADLALHEQQQSGNKPSPLADPVLEAFRLVLVDPAGPFGVPKEIEKNYPPESKAALVELREKLKGLEAAKPELPHALAVADRQPQNLHVHIRGNHLTQGPEVPRQFPRVLAGDTQQPIGNHTSGRLELAEWLTRPDHPLTSRVMVNRIWQGHFGEGLVRSPDNFGRLGEQPDNQPLLDWLARRFVASGWSIKQMHRLIMLSSAYQMSTSYNDRAAQIDPENRLLWRMHRRRLEAEEIRDALLATAGQIDGSMSGTLLTNKNHTYVTSTASANNVNYENNRRSVYLPIIRSAVYEVFQAFDFADPSTMMGKRPSTTVAPQALFMMNSPLAERQTRAMAEQLLQLQDVDEPARVGKAYERAYGRLPSEQETSRALDFVNRYQTESTAGLEPGEARLRAWQALCRVIVSSNEFIFLE